MASRWITPMHSRGTMEETLEFTRNMLLAEEPDTEVFEEFQRQGVMIFSATQTEVPFVECNFNDIHLYLDKIFDRITQNELFFSYDSFTEKYFFFGKIE